MGRAVALPPALALAVLDKMLKFYVKFLCDGQGTVRRAILYADKSCSTFFLRGRCTEF